MDTDEKRELVSQLIQLRALADSPDALFLVCDMEIDNSGIRVPHIKGSNLPVDGSLGLAGEPVTIYSVLLRDEKVFLVVILPSGELIIPREILDNAIHKNRFISIINEKLEYVKNE
jgi:hypothetical protein